MRGCCCTVTLLYCNCNTGSGYDIYNFMDRTTGFEFDNSAVPWGCQV